MPLFVRTTAVAAVVGALAAWIGLSPHDRHGAPAPLYGHARPRLDATSDSEARQMRRVTLGLAAQAAAGARCDPAAPAGRYSACAIPPLRHLGAGGRMAATALNAPIAGVPSGRCKGYLLRLQAATGGAGDAARWLLPQLYSGDRRRAQHEVAEQLALVARMLRGAAHAAPVQACAMPLRGPAI